MENYVKIQHFPAARTKTPKASGVFAPDPLTRGFAPALAMTCASSLLKIVLPRLVVNLYTWENLCVLVGVVIFVIILWLLMVLSNVAFETCIVLRLHL
jgi:hypothetical protein